MPSRNDQDPEDSQQEGDDVPASTDIAPSPENQADSLSDDESKLTSPNDRIPEDGQQQGEDDSASMDIGSSPEDQADCLRQEAVTTEAEAQQSQEVGDPLAAHTGGHHEPTVTLPGDEAPAARTCPPILQ